MCIRDRLRRWVIIIVVNINRPHINRMNGKWLYDSGRARCYYNIRLYHVTCTLHSRYESRYIMGPGCHGFVRRQPRGRPALQQAQRVQFARGSVTVTSHESSALHSVFKPSALPSSATGLETAARVWLTVNVMHTVCMYANEKAAARCYWSTCQHQWHNNDVTSDVIRTEERAAEAVRARDKARDDHTGGLWLTDISSENATQTNIDELIDVVG